MSISGNWRKNARLLKIAALAPWADARLLVKMIAAVSESVS